MKNLARVKFLIFFMSMSMSSYLVPDTGALTALAQSGQVPGGRQNGNRILSVPPGALPSSHTRRVLNTKPRVVLNTSNIAVLEP